MKNSPQDDLSAEFTGVLLGTAVGDALGLPAENLSPERIRKRWSGKWRMRFLFGRGMISDDTEHTIMVAQALLSDAFDALLAAVDCQVWIGRRDYAFLLKNYEGCAS